MGHGPSSSGSAHITRNINDFEGPYQESRPPLNAQKEAHTRPQNIKQRQYANRKVKQHCPGAQRRRRVAPYGQVARLGDLRTWVQNGNQTGKRAGACFPMYLHDFLNFCMRISGRQLLKKQSRKNKCAPGRIPVQLDKLGVSGGCPFPSLA